MLTVVIPIFNKGAYIQRTLNSVFAQSCPVAEIIVVNDGSTDGGEQIAKRQCDPRIRVIDQKNCGVSVARNVGIEAATQPYIAFLDADDVWLPGFLTQIKKMIAQFPDADLYGTGFTTVAHGREIRRYAVRSREFGGSKGEGALGGGENVRPAFGPVDFFKVWSHGHVIHTSSMVVPRQAALDVGGFPVGVTHGEDLEFWAKLALSGAVVLSPEVLTHYHVDVPGQAVEYWDGAYKRDFEVLPYHRFLACELRRCSINTGTLGHGERNKSFEKYCRRELRNALLQRLIRERFDVAKVFCDEINVTGLRKGFLLGLCCQVAEERRLQPVAKLAVRVLRAVRVFLAPSNRSQVE